MADKRIEAKTKQEAWDIVNRIFPTDYEQDEASSQRAGYPVYRSTADGRYYDYICDLNDRLEINLADGNRAINVWIVPEPDQEETDGASAESRRNVVKRLQKLTAWFAEEMLNEEEKGRKNREEFEKAKAENPDRVVMMVDCSENNVRCMKDCMTASIKATKYIRSKKNDVQEWQIAGINAMFDQVNKENIVPYDLPYAILGTLLILDQPEKEQ